MEKKINYFLAMNIWWANEDEGNQNISFLITTMGRFVVVKYFLDRFIIIIIINFRQMLIVFSVFLFLVYALFIINV